MITVSRVNQNLLRVNLIPSRQKEDENPALATPLSFIGTPEELDRDLASDRAEGNPQSAIDTRCWFGTWLAGKGALCRETLQATGRITRILNRPKRACTDSHHANSENQLESSSQKEPSFFSERMCDISAVSHEWGSPHPEAKVGKIILPLLLA
jgi:hypothetical protein